MTKADVARLRPSRAGKGLASRAVRERLRRMEWIAATQAKLAELDFDLDRFMGEVVERVPQITAATGVIIELVEGEDMVYRATSPDLSQHVGLRLGRAGSLSGRCVAAAETLYCADAETDPRVDKAACARIGLRSMLCTPLMANGAAVGVLKALSNRPDQFDQGDVEVLDLLAKALGTALARQVAFEAMARETEARRRLEVSLRASEARANRVIADAHHAVVTMNAEGRVTGWNRAAEQIFGWTAEEAVGAALAELIVPERTRAMHGAGLQRFLATGETRVMNRRIEVEALNRAGEVFPVELAISATPDVDGWSFTAMIQDIRERKAETELFENAFHHAPIGLALVDLAGRFVKVNDAFAQIVGYAPDAVLALTFQDITHADDLDRDLALLGQLTDGAVSEYQMDKRYIRGDGRIVWVNLVVSMVRHPDGRPKHYIAQVQDLTERMETEARYRLMAENTTDMIVMSDFDGRTTFVSAGVKAMTGWTVAEALGRGPGEYVHPEDIAALHDVFVRTRKGETGLRARWRGWHKTEERWIWLESSPSLLTAEGEPPRCVDVVRDISLQVAQEAALAQARADAEAAAEAKAEFLANMSHEIRTPLTAVIGFSGLLREQGDLNPDARRFSDRIDTAGRALLTVVNDILDFSKLEKGEVAMQPRATDAVAMAREVIGLFQPQADAKGLKLRFEAKTTPAFVSIDPQALRQVLFNLLGNAVKFTDVGSVALKIGYRDERLTVVVKDTGPGLSPDQQAKLFQRFSQADTSTTRKHGGTGLGLAICKALVEAMGGEIGVESGEGKGSRFWFEAPAPLAVGFEALEDAPAPNLEGVRVLVVDDKPVNRELARALLAARGAEVHEAEDGQAAVEAAQAYPFDVILMDMRMPRLTGAEAAERIRTAPGPNRFVPILAFSARESGAVPPGFDGEVSKPVSAPVLFAAIAAALQDQMIAPQGGLDVSIG